MQWTKSSLTLMFFTAFIGTLARPFTWKNGVRTMNLVDLKKLLHCIDLTNLNDQCSEADIMKLCRAAITSQGYVAAVCLYPPFVSLASQLLMNTPIKIATVVNFPKAVDSLEKITHDIKQAILDGASEIDAVMPHEDDGAFVRHCKKLCGNKILLKIILETGELDESHIERKSKIAIAHGADFLKTSTGKIPIGATAHAAALMLTAIKNSGRPVGFKASGGIKTVEDADIYVSLVKEILGESAFSPRHFRIGASKLLDEMLRALPSQPIQSQ